MAGFLGALDAKRVDPEVFAVRDAAFAGNPPRHPPFAAGPLVDREAEGVKTPVFLMQGRRDFAFRARPGADRLSRAGRAEAALDRPQRTRLVGHRGGHAGDARRERPVVRPLSPRRRRAARQAGRGLARGRGAAFGAVRRARVVVRGRLPFRTQGANAIAQSGRYRLALPAPRPCSRGLRRPDRAGHSERERWLVPSSPCSAPGRPPARRSSWRREACRLRAGRRTYHIALNDQATFLPRGSPPLTLGSSTLAQNPANLLYLALPLAPTARLAVTGGSVALPELRDARLAMRRALLVLGAALNRRDLAAAGTTADPGLTPTSLLIGGTVPLSGEAAARRRRPRREERTSAYVNSKGGVNGRTIEYRFYDDAYNPAQTVQQTRRLVEQDGVFAIFNAIGTGSNTRSATT